MTRNSKIAKSKSRHDSLRLISSVVLIFSLIACTLLSGCTAQQGEIGEWYRISDKKSVITKAYAGQNGFKYQYSADYSEIDKIEEEDAVDLIAQYILASYSLDYTSHFALFQDEFIEISIYPEMEKSGYGYNAALEKINSTTNGIFGLKICDTDIVIKDVKYNSETFADRYLAENGVFAEAGIDASKIEEYVTYYFGVSSLEYSEYLRYVNIESDYGIDTDGLTCYKYDGKWYLEPRLLDDDLSIDLLNSKDGEGLLKPRTVRGTVIDIGDNFVLIDAENEKYYFSTDSKVEVTEGDTVRAEGTVTTRMELISDGSECQVGVLGSIVAFDE